ncbi:hypothetical protein TNCV_1830311 [Trichonephila clavipes]|nr:hypothetical protein TNCV_1830311 [Trichonephila clavipes]
MFVENKSKLMRPVKEASDSKVRRMKSERQIWQHRRNKTLHMRSGRCRPSAPTIVQLSVACVRCKPAVENADKITEIIEVDRHVSSRSIAQEPKIDHKKSFKPFALSWIQKEARCLGATPINTKNMMDRISFCEALAKWK